MIRTLLLPLSVGTLTLSAAAQATMLRASVSSEGRQANEWSSFSSISADGSLIAFVSTATNLVPADTNGAHDIFVHDRLHGTTSRVSVSTSGLQGDGNSWFPEISADGRQVAFMSYATNLVPGDVNGFPDVFVHDLVTHQTELVSVDPAGTLANEGSSSFVGISDDGRFVAFCSDATNLVPGDTNGLRDVFVRDRIAGTTTRVSVDSAGLESDGESGPEALISADGRFVTFVSSATRLVAGDTNGQPDVFVHDRVNGQTTRVSVNSSGEQLNGYTGLPSMSADGRFVVFVTNANNVSPLDTDGGLFDLYVHDRSNGSTELLSADSPGYTFANVGGPVLSPDGSHIAYQYVVSQFGTEAQIVVQDLLTGDRTLVTPYRYQQSSLHPSLNGNGSVVAFTSTLNLLIADDTNGVSDVFVADLSTQSPTIATYCTAGTSSLGCTPSLSGAGIPQNLAPSGFALSVTGAEGQQTGSIFYGVVGPLASPFGSGSSVLCVNPPIRRTPIQSTGGTTGACDGAFTLDWNHFITTHPGLRLWGEYGGRTVWAQAWVRDPGSPEGGVLSNAVWFTVLP